MFHACKIFRTFKNIEEYITQKDNYLSYPNQKCLPEYIYFIVQSTFDVVQIWLYLFLNRKTFLLMKYSVLKMIKSRLQNVLQTRHSGYATPKLVTNAQLFFFKFDIIQFLIFTEKNKGGHN